MTKIKVSKEAWRSLEQAYAEIVAADPVAAIRWQDQCSTSTSSKAAGGMAKLETDYDWLLLFFAWRNGVKIPRE